MYPPDRPLFWIAKPIKRRALTLQAHAFAARSATSLLANRPRGLAPVGFVEHATREKYTALAFASVPRLGAVRAPGGQRTQTGMSSDWRVMAEGSNIALVSKSERATGTADDTLTLSAISVVASILTNVLHEGVGHGLTALLTGANSEVLTTVAWSSAFDSRLVEAGGTLVNLASALVFGGPCTVPRMQACLFGTSCSSLVHSTCSLELGTFSFQV